MEDDLEVLRTREGFFPKEPLFPTGGLMPQQEKPVAKVATALSFTKTCPKCGFSNLQPGRYDQDKDKMKRICPVCCAKWEEEPLDKKLNPKPETTNGLGGERIWNQLVSSIRQALAWWHVRKKSKTA